MYFMPCYWLICECVYTYISILSVYQLIHVWGLLLQAIINNFVMNIFLSSGQIPNGRIPGLEGNAVFNLLKNCPAISHSNWNILWYHNHQQWARVLISPVLSDTCHDLFPTSSFKKRYSGGEECCFIVVTDIVYVSMYWFLVSFKSSVHFVLKEWVVLLRPLCRDLNPRLSVW